MLLDLILCFILGSEIDFFLLSTSGCKTVPRHSPMITKLAKVLILQAFNVLIT